MVLRYLIDNKDKVVSRKELLENVMAFSPDIETRTVDIFISRLRKYFEHDLFKSGLQLKVSEAQGTCSVSSLYISNDLFYKQKPA